MTGARCDRRALLASALAAGGAAALGAPASARASAPADGLAGLHDALATEQVAVFAAQTMLGRGTVGGTAAALTRRILEHDQAHVHILSTQLTLQGRPLPVAPASAAQADRRLTALHASLHLAGVRTQDDALRLLYDVESLAVGAYYKALQTLADPSLIHTAASIMAADAQHASAIGGLLHPGKWDRVVPVGSVEGKR